MTALQLRSSELAEVPIVEVTFDDPAFRLLALHLVPPLDQPRVDTWNRQFDALVERTRERDLPLVIAGDFNATNHARGLRALDDAGLRDVHLALGHGLATTWPNGTELRPPLHIDHVLVSPAIVPLEVRQGEGVGSNHAPVIADLAIPAQ